MQTLEGTHIRIQCCANLHLILVRVKFGVAPKMTPNDEPREQLVLDGVDRVLDHAQHVEPRQDRLRELHVLLERDRGVVAAPNRVRGGDDGTPGLQRRDDARFGDRDRLLLHRLVDGRPVRVVHLVELVDETGAFIGEDECAALERPFPRDGILADAGCETDSGRTLAGCEDGSVCGLLNVLQELRLRCTRVAKQKDVNVSTDTVLSVDVLGDTAEEREGKGSLDILVTIDGRGDRLDNPLANPIVPSESTDLLLVVLSEAEGGELVFLLVDVVSLEDCREDRESVFGVERGIEVVAIYSGDLLR